MENDFPLTRGGLWDAKSARATGVDRSRAAARDAVARSFLNRLGRLPTEEEFSQSIGYFLPDGLGAHPTTMGRTDLHMVLTAQSGVSPPADALQFETDSGYRSSPGISQVASTRVLNNPSVVSLPPRATGDLVCNFGKGRYAGWLRLAVKDTPSANFRLNTGPTRPAFLPRPPVVVEFSGDVQIANRVRSLPLEASMSVDDRMAGQTAYQELATGVMEGPGQIYLKATNKSPFDVDVTLGARAV